MLLVSFSRRVSFGGIVLAALYMLAGTLAAPVAAQSVNFSPSGLQGISLGNPTSLQFGPDGRLYVSQQNGEIKAFTIQRNGPSDYEATSAEAISLVQDIPNHDDDGTPAPEVDDRQVTGIVVAGTATNPVLYVGSSDPRIGAGSGGNDLGLDTNSGIISKLTCPGGVAGDQCQGGWEMVHLVRGLPRSEENHSTNGLELDTANNVLLVAQGGHANAGAPSNNFALTTEYTLSAAILEIDLAAIAAMSTKTDDEGQPYKYDLPTVDDPSRANEADGSDPGDPFGGNDGLNQAKLVVDGPVQIYSPGYRNAYDLVLTEDGQLYVVDNGANGGWGGYPQYEESYDCTNQYLSGEPGSTGPGPDPATYPADVTLLEGSDGEPDDKVNNDDNLHYVANKGYYAGHPNPVRANPAGAGLYTNGTFRDGSDPDNPLPSDWGTVVPQANPVECDYRQAGVDDGALHTWGHSTNGLAEYTASNFSGALQGDLLAAGYNGEIHRIELNSAGDGVANEESFASNFGSQPLDVVAQADDDPFAGTVWAATYGANNITVFEPQDFGQCSGDDDDAIDEDSDDYSNTDEIDNGTNPCSAASKPPDFDGTLAADGFKDSDLNDLDDDDDGLLDTEDPFAINADNGTATSLPIHYSLFNNDPGFGFYGVGFTGLMTNGSDYLDLKAPDEDLVVGGASGLFTDNSVGPGNALASSNDQVNAFQFGVDVDAGTAPFTVEAQLNGPFGLSGEGASQGLYIGTGDQDNYFKLVLNDGSDGTGGFRALLEEGGVVGSDMSQDAGGALDASQVVLYLSVDPAASTVQAKYAAADGPVTALGDPVSIPSGWLDTSDDQGLAVGFIATSAGAAPEFTATWDYVNVTKDPSGGAWQHIAGFNETRHENAFVQAGDKFYLLGGRESSTVKIYDPAAGTWSDGAASPVPLHHFQAVALDGLIYAVGALKGSYPDEDSVEHVYIYDPAADTWITGPQLPAERLRGSGGAAVYDGKIYLAGGNDDGHNGPASAKFDVYDPATGTWTTLPDLPRPRDHFFATVAGDKLYAIGGRVSDVSSGNGNVFDDTIAEVDIYDFSTGGWSTLPASANLPTARAAPATALLNGEIVVAGGESEQPEAHEEVEAFDVETQTWRTLTPMMTPRHATQALVSNGGFYVAGGSDSQGGAGSPLPLEGFYFFGQTSPDGTPLTASTLGAPGTLDFGAVAPGSSTGDTLTLENTGGDQAIVIEGIVLSGSGDFSLDEPLGGPVVLAPGASLDLALTFAPADAGAETGTLTLTHSGGSTLGVALEGEGSEVLYRLNAGGGGYTDTEGNLWEADSYVTGGGSYHNPEAAPIANTDDDELYLTERSGADPFFQYAIPVPEADTYRVDLHFAEIYFGADGGDPGGGAGDRVFSVDIESGQNSFSGYDIYADVGPAAAVVKTFFVEVTDGTLNLDFTASTNQPKVSALVVRSAGSGNLPPQVDLIADQFSVEGDDVSNMGLAVSATDPDGGPQNLSYSLSGQPAGVDIEPTNGQVIGMIADGAAANSPYTVTATVSDGADQSSTSFTWTVTEEPPGTQPVVARLNAGGATDPITDGEGRTWTPDEYFAGEHGKTYSNENLDASDIDVSDPAATAAEIYLTERSSNQNLTGFSYHIPVPEPGSYTVNLHFAEIYFGAEGGEPGGAGQRVFSVDIEGGSPPELDGYDINADVGTLTATVKTFTMDVADDTLDLVFDASTNRPKLSAIEVLKGDATLAGVVNYYPGGANGGPALEGATLELADLSDGSVLKSTSTASDGSFALTASTGQSYALEAKRADDTPVAKGVTALDLSLIRRHILGISNLETYPQVAADVNASGGVTALDLSLMRQLILGIRQGFGEGGTGGLWECAVAGATAVPMESIYSYDPLDAEQDGQDFHCFRLGDVNGSWQPAGNEPAALAATQAATQAAAANDANASGINAAPVRLFVKDQTARMAATSTVASRTDAGGGAATVVVPVQVRNFQHVGGMQFTLTWDAEALAYEGVEAMNLPGVSQANVGTHRADEGRLSFVWVHPGAESHTLADGEALLAVRFRLKRGGGKRATVGFSSEVTALAAHRAVGSQLYAVDVQGESGAIETAALPETFALQGNYPNPFSERTTLAFDLPDAADLTLEVYDVLGRRVWHRTAQMSAGAGKKMVIEAGALSSGIYLYRLIAELPSGQQVKTGRLMLVR